MADKTTADENLSALLVRVINRVYKADSLKDLESVKREAKNFFAEKDKDLFETVQENIKQRRADLEEKAVLNNTIAAQKSTIAAQKSTIAEKDSTIAEMDNILLWLQKINDTISIEELRNVARKAHNFFTQQAGLQHEPDIITNGIYKRHDEIKELAIQKGTYFNTIDQVWGKEYHPVIDEDGKAAIVTKDGLEAFDPDADGKAAIDLLKRAADADGQAAIALLKRAGDQIPQEYKEIVNMYNDTEEVNKIELAMTWDNSYTSGKRVQLFPCDFFGNEGNGEIAHLIPNAPGCAIAHDDVAEWALGLSDTMAIPQRSPMSCFHPISCFPNLDGEDPVAKRRKLAVVGSKENKDANKTKGSSLKHHRFNHIRLSSQSRFIDKNPTAMFVPCVESSFIKNWDGEKATQCFALWAIGWWKVKKKLKLTLLPLELE